MDSNLEGVEEDATSASEHDGISRMLADALQQMDEIIANSLLDFKSDANKDRKDSQNEENGSHLYISSPSLSTTDQPQKTALPSKAKSMDSVCALTLEDWINKNCQKPSPLAVNPQLAGVATTKVANLVKDISHVINKTEDADGLKSAVSYESLKTLRDWLLPDIEELFDVDENSSTLISKVRHTLAGMVDTRTALKVGLDASDRLHPLLG
ncbi:hypothetical protein RRG08_042971 [Elysia crispata]|uniref:Uncharacterized protein n=1 Tax=Elysia crispata TaxID=231223 RepID=A0AAE1E6Q1_9GAST|nr:hypothetical protein RRG08_042971 [Elysia crispata]